MKEGNDLREERGCDALRVAASKTYSLSTQVIRYLRFALTWAAAYDALSGSEADFIAHPTYSYTTKNYFIIQQFEATVEGYPGFYSNFRSFDPAKRRVENNLDNAVNRKIVNKLVIGDGLDK